MPTPASTEDPAALIGFGPKLGQMRVCQRCPDRAKAEAIAHRHNFTVYLTICAACFQAEQEKRNP